jgi:hypothetical protein
MGFPGISASDSIAQAGSLDNILTDDAADEKEFGILAGCVSPVDARYASPETGQIS